MSLEILLGEAGSGKSTALLQEIIDHAVARPQEHHLLLVPEQFCLSAQRRLMELHPRHAMLNIEALSFDHLAARSFRELSAESREILSDSAKNMFLSLAVPDCRGKLQVYEKQTRFPSFVLRLAGLFAEWTMNDIGPDRIGTLSQEAALPRLLKLKLADLALLYEAFQKRLGDRQTAEALLPRFSRLLPRSQTIQADYLYLDGFTGFTSVQYRILEQLLRRCPHTKLLLTLPGDEDPYEKEKGQEDLFALTRRTVERLEYTARQAGQQSHISFLPVFVEKEWEFRLLRQHLFRGSAGLKEEAMTRPPERLQLIQCPTPEEEARMAASLIRKLMREKGLRFRDIAITVSDTELYLPHLKREFREWEIPYFSDRREPLAHHPLLRLVAEALEAVNDHFAREGLMRLLKNPLSPLSREESDCFENYLLATGIRWGKALEKPFERLRKRHSGESPEFYRTQAEAQREAMEALRLKIMEPLQRLQQNLPVRTTAASGAAALLRFLEDWGLLEQMDRLEAEREAAGGEGISWQEALAALTTFFEDMKNILGDMPLSRKAFSELVGTALEGLNCGRLPAAPDQVVIGDILRSRLGDIKVLIFLGMNEGLVPKKRSQSRLLSDRDRLALSFFGEDLGYTDLKAMSEERFYLYTLLQKPIQAIYIAYSTRGSGDEKELLPAFAVQEIQSIFPKIQVQIFRPGRETQQPESGFPALQLSPACVEALYGQALHVGISGLEYFAGCPYRFFMRYGLKLDERQEYAWKASDHGIFFHKVVECMLRELQQEAFCWADISAEKKEAIIARSMERALQEAEALGEEGDADRAYKLDRWKRFFGAYWDYLEQKGLGDGFVPAEFELFFGSKDAEVTRILLQDGHALQLSGVIDRIDLRQAESGDYLRVVDYKTRQETKFSPALLVEGMQLQLAVYLDIALRLYEKRNPGKTLRAGGMCYGSLAEHWLEWAENPEQIRENLWDKWAYKGLRAQEVTPMILLKNGKEKVAADAVSARQLELTADYARRRIQELGQQVYSGDITPAPRGQRDYSSCTYCAYKEACPFDEERRGCSYRTDTLKTEEAWQLIRGETESLGKEEADAVQS